MPIRFMHSKLSTKALLSTSVAITLFSAVTAAIAWRHIGQFPRQPLGTPDAKAHIRSSRCCEDGGQPLEGLVAVLLLSVCATGAALALTYLQGRQSRKGRLALTPAAPCVPIRQARVGGPGHLWESILHDLRNPLAAIHGAAQILQDTELSPTHIKRLGGNIYTASQRIQILLDDLLDASRGENRALERSSLRELVLAACRSLSAMANSHRTVLAVDIQPEIELPVERRQMERAFVNLIGNAIEAMPEGGEVRIWAQVIKGSALVHVDDTGPGVAPDIRHKVFQPFVTAGKQGGMGLGLAFTRQTVLEHQGDISVDTAPGGGARFTLRLPGAHIGERAPGTTGDGNPLAQVYRSSVVVWPKAGGKKHPADGSSAQMLLVESRRSKQVDVIRAGRAWVLEKKN